MINKIRIFLTGLIACLFIASCSSDYDEEVVLNDNFSMSSDTLKTRSFEDGRDMIMLSWRKVPSFDVFFNNFHRSTTAAFVLAQMDDPSEASSYLGYFTEGFMYTIPDEAKINLYDLWTNNGGCPNHNFYLPNELLIYSYISNSYLYVGNIHSEVQWHTPYYLIMYMYVPEKFYQNCHAIYVIRGFELGGGGDVKLFELEENAQPYYQSSSWIENFGL